MRRAHQELGPIETARGTGRPLGCPGRTAETTQVKAMVKSPASPRAQPDHCQPGRPPASATSRPRPACPRGLLLLGLRLGQTHRGDSALRVVCL